MYEAAISTYQSFLQKDNFFAQQPVNTEQELEQLIAGFSGKKDHLFRGLNEARFMLYSSLQRDWIWQQREAQGTDHQAFLEKLVATARLHCGGALALYIQRHGGDYHNDVCVLSMLHHQGLRIKISSAFFTGAV